MYPEAARTIIFLLFVLTITWGAMSALYLGIPLWIVVGLMIATGLAIKYVRR